MEQKIRTSQALHTYGPGAIADFPDLSVIILSHDLPQSGDNNLAEFWGEDRDLQVNRLDDERLAIAFNVECFVSPPSTDSVKKAGIQTLRFPSKLVCPKTYELFDVRELELNDKYYTDYSSRNKRTVDETFVGYSSPMFNNRKLIPVRFVIATEDGHLDDFPFDWYVHTKCNKSEQVGMGNRLFLKTQGNTASLKNLILESKSQNGEFICSVTLERIFDQEDTFVDINDSSKDYLQFVKNKMPKPWLGRNSKKKLVGGNSIKDYYYYPIDDVRWPPFGESTSEEEKKKTLSRYPRTLQRGAGNLYFPIIYKGISIPKNGYNPKLPEDFISILKTTIRVLESAGLLNEDSDKCEEFIKLFKHNLHTKFSHLNYPEDECKMLIKKYFTDLQSNSGQYTISQLREQEFKCFLNANVQSKKEEWYDSKIMDGKYYKFGKSGLVKKVVLLNKLRELKIFKGFTRIKPLMFEDLIFDSPIGLTGRKKREVQRIQNPRSNPDTTTLPATEVKGEGIFIQFDDDMLISWENKLNVKSRAKLIFDNYSKYRRLFELEDDQLITPRYIALHTFSHLLINELSIECGYGSSALSEIIYCGPVNSEQVMNGILIYTSTSDSEGTLGGLVEKGEVASLVSIVEKALSKASWCSSDPLCIEDGFGKGFMGVNLAACHSCCLLPETSCCNINKFLDRGLVIGTLENQDIGLFSEA